MTWAELTALAQKARLDAERPLMAAALKDNEFDMKMVRAAEEAGIEAWINAVQRAALGRGPK